MCNLFIYPGYRFKMTDALITNFHLPQSTLLMLVSALAGRRPGSRCLSGSDSKRIPFLQLRRCHVYRIIRCIVTNNRVIRISSQRHFIHHTGSDRRIRNRPWHSPYPRLYARGDPGQREISHSRGSGDAGAEIILGNTYHLYLRPGCEVIE